MWDVLGDLLPMALGIAISPIPMIAVILAKGVELAVGIRPADTGEELTVHIRNRVLHIKDGLAPDAEAVVEVTPDQVGGNEAPTVISGDSTVWDRLHDRLDTEPTPSACAPGHKTIRHNGPPTIRLPNLQTPSQRT